MNANALFGISAGAVLCVCASLMTSCRDGGQDAASEQASSPVRVKTAALVRQDVTSTGQWYGYLRGVEDAAIRPQVTGTLVKKNYKDGSYVREGEVLFEIDKALFEATLHQAQASLAQAEGSLQQANAAHEKNRLDVDRYTKLVASGSVSEKNLTDSQQALRENEAQILVAEAQIQAAKAQVESAQTNLDYATIKAPISGIAGIAQPSVGDLLSPSMTEPLVTISSIEPVRVDFSIPEQMVLSALKRWNGTTDAKYENFPFRLILSDGSVYEHQGEIVSVDRAVNRSMGTLDVVGHVPNPNRILRPGMAVTVQADVSFQKDALLVPPRAVMARQSADFIMVLGPGDVPVMCRVALGNVVNVPVKDASGRETVQPMQVISGQGAPLDVQLRAQGVAGALTDVQVIVEGTTLAALAMQAKRPVLPEPYVYEASQPLVPSKAAAGRGAAVPDESAGSAGNADASGRD